VKLRAPFDRLRAAPELQAYLVLSLAFLLSRYLVDLLGLRFNLVLDWMFVTDPAWLREHLLKTLFYAHAFPPGPNLLAGLIMKLGPDRAIANAHALFQAFGLLLVLSLFALGRAAGLGRAGAFALALGFCLTPAVLYFEHLFSYEGPTIALLCLAAVLFRRGVAQGGFWTWSGCFLACTAICWLRSMFHLAWFVLIVGMALWWSRSYPRLRVLVAAAVPALLLVGVYLKNLIVFGVFGIFTWGVGSLTLATIRNMPPELRQQWVNEGKLSPFALINVYAGPRAYLHLFPSAHDPKWPEMLNVLERPSHGGANYDHWFFLHINQRRRDDARYYLKHRFGEYAGTVWANMLEYFSPSTLWHPRDGHADAPHHKHRQVLGGWERLYNTLVHGPPLRPTGLYLLLPLVLAWAVVRFVGPRGRDAPAPDRALLAFLMLQVGFITTVAVLFSFGEAGSYRYQIDPLIAVLYLLAGKALIARLRARRATA
jgi:hypothetical protein